MNGYMLKSKTPDGSANLMINGEKVLLAAIRKPELDYHKQL
jgi:hypothetical protein